MDAIDLIVAKRDGGRLSDDQIDWFNRSSPLLITTVRVGIQITTR